MTNKTFSKNSVVYLDNNATTSLSQDVSGVLLDIVINDIYGNPNSSHNQGVKTRTLVEAARHGVASSLNCSPSEIIFTSGGTEANNLALRGIYDPVFSLAEEVVISAVEHSSVHNTAISIVPEEKLRLIPLKRDGSLDMEWAERLITEDTALVSVMLANNETGSIFPIKKIVAMAHSVGALVHCDAVQAYGKMPVDVKDLGVDMLSVSGHKVHALSGVGALYVRNGIQLNSQITGGGQELGLRSGTENYVGITTLGVAASDIRGNVEGFPEGLRNTFEFGLIKRVPNITINAVDIERLPNTSSITFHGIHASAMVEALADEGIYASAGAACSTGSLQPSRTLKAMGLTDEDALSTVRFSFSTLSQTIDVALAISACAKCAAALRGETINPV